MSNREYKYERRNSLDRGRRNSRLSSPEGLMEDEEDYEEFVRSMERRKGGEGSRSGERKNRRSGWSRTEDPGSRQGASWERNAERNMGRPGYRSAGDLDEEAPRSRAAGYGQGGRSRGRTDYEDWEETRSPGDGRGGRPAGNGGRADTPRRRKKRGFFGILFRLLLIVLLVAAIAGGILFYKMRDVLSLRQIDSVELEDQLAQGIPYKVRSDEHMNGFRNIALFGVDSRSGDLLEGDNRSDTMMICSINEKTGEIRLVSVFRDTLLDVGGGEYRKANTAYALGGPAQAIDMMNKNLDMNIVDFVTVGFEGLAHTIDALGGIEIEIDEEERGYLNQYLYDMHKELGTDETPVEETGLVTVTGIQATAYSRIRYTAGDDFRRAERQRTVLSKTLAKARQASPAELVRVADNVLGDVATSLSSTEILGLIMKAGSYELVDTGGLPREEYRGFRSSVEEGDYVLPINLSDNVVWLHEFLFGDTGYVLSEEAAARNDAIIDYGAYNSWIPY